MKNKLLKLFKNKIKEEPTSLEDGNKEEYLERCFRNYLGDKFTIEESLFLFSYLIKKKMAWDFTSEMSATANDFLETGWIGSNGKILISAKEANDFVGDNIGDIK